MYKNFNLTDEERKQIMEQHSSFGYKKPLKEQGVPTSIPYPTGSGPKPKPSKTPAVATNAAEKPAVPANKVDAKNSLYNDSTKHTQIDPTDPNFGKNIKQSDKLIGKKATLYANAEDAVMAYQAGKSNPQSPGSIIVQINSIDYSDNNTLQIRITPDSAKTNYSTTTQVEIMVFNRVKGTFTIVGDTKVYYSESIKNILINDYFSTELASNNKAQQSNIAEETTNSSLIGKSATFYASEREAQDAYKAGKSNPSAKGAIIGTITGMDKIENDYVSFKVKMTKGIHDDRGAVGKLLGGGTVFTYMRENGFFTVEGMRGTNYYSESVKQILNKEFFTSDLASNNKMQPTSNMAEEIDTDDEEMELSSLYDGGDDMEDDSPDVNMEFGGDPDEFEDLYDLSMAKQSLPKEKAVDMSRSGPKDIDYDSAQDFYNEIPGMYDQRSEPKKPTSDYYLKTYGTPDPDMESETLADRKKNAPLDFPKYTDKDRRNPENMLSWEQKKAAMAQRAEKEAARSAAREKKLAAASLKPGVNESKRSIRLTESQLINLVKTIVEKTAVK